MSMQGLVEQLGPGLDRLPGGKAAAAARRAALERFEALGLPNRRIERWHYTDLGPLADKAFDYAPESADEGMLAKVAAELAASGLDAAQPRCVFVDGQLAESLSGTDSTSGLVRETSADTTSFAGANDLADTALVALNAALAAERVILRINEPLDTPITLVFVTTGRRLASQTRIRIELAPGASASIVEHFVALPASGEAWLNLVTEIDQAESSSLELYRLQELGAEQYATGLVQANLAQEARLTATSVELGGKLVRNELEISLEGERADVGVFGLALTSDRQHCDTRVAVDHEAPRTTSFQEYRAIAADSSRSIFNGKVTVREDAQHIEARQRNDNLLLSRKAEIDTKPELEIYADQVICSHGATVGELSEDHLFYLRARGIDEESARGILTAAFAEKILARFPAGALAERVRSAVDARLPRRIELE